MSSWVKPVTLVGRTIRLEPLCEAHAASLARHVELDLFLLFAGLRPREASERGLADYIRGRLALPMVQSFAMVLQEGGEAVGHSSFMDIQAENSGLEIGSTWIARPWQGTKVNPEAKLLMLAHAFDELGCERVMLKTDLRNLQSQRGIEKLGAVKEGVLRRNVRMVDGYMRSTVMYSILREEWPRVRQGLEARLA
ncbi:MAG: GNAT family N-acetyltransferase [Fimbriimonas ginsengisoli]|uniref:GNAT family N-acetyltransferase n=1 Tax=Fimbriimonas ginsengisoli TaxID=1005039 RepID=A0A931PUD4_FIMGI|nr:GNAT family N-acetyltransferase [Fimbriimonas ginsengisoli]